MKLDDNAMRALVGENLRRLRSQAKPRVTQAELAKAARLHRTEVGQIERGQRMPRAETVFKLAAVLGVGPDRLWAGAQWDSAGGRFKSAQRPDERR